LSEQIQVKPSDSGALLEFVHQTFWYTFALEVRVAGEVDLIGPWSEVKLEIIGKYATVLEDSDGERFLSPLH
jgi:hypothetical protein